MVMGQMFSCVKLFATPISYIADIMNLLLLW